MKYAFLGEFVYRATGIANELEKAWEQLVLKRNHRVLPSQELASENNERWHFLEEELLEAKLGG
jgi:hypothetical protein